MHNKIKIIILDLVKGIAIGAGAILPGISSGVLCVIFGIYDKLLDSILNFFKNIKENVKFLLPLALGGVIGIILFGNILNYAFYKFPIITKTIFIVLILRTIPQLIKDVGKKEKIKIKDLIYFVIAFGIGIATVILENTLQIEDIENASYIYLIICGILMSVGVVVPRSQ